MFRKQPQQLLHFTYSIDLQWLNIIFATFQKYPRFLLQLNLKALGKIDKNDD